MNSFKRATLSVIVHTKNEAKNITACIRSCIAIADELLIVDMKSTDDTVARAKKLGASILHVKDYGYVEPARDLALKKVKGDWILLLDADERLHPTLRKTIARLLTRRNADVVLLPRKNIILGTWAKHGMRWPDYQVRLFRKGSVQWKSEIHSQPIIRGSVMSLSATQKNAIIHQHSVSIDQLVNKISQQARAEHRLGIQNTVTTEFVKHQISHEIAWRYQEHQGYKDGITGYIDAKFMEYYRFLEFAYYWERHKHLKFSQVQLQQLAVHQPFHNDSIWVRLKKRIFNAI